MPDNRIACAIDTAADLAGVALFEDGVLLSELTWRSHRQHSRELLPGLEWLLERAGRPKTDLEAVYVSIGPGSYAGMRVGVSTAKALAYGLGLQIVGIGRLEADAFPFRGLVEGRVFAVHAAGRAELAWAAYDAAGAEVIAPRLGSAEALIEALTPSDLVCGELASLPQTLTESAVRLVEARSNRVEAIGLLGEQRRAAGRIDNPDTLVPLYLRAPAIGPQPPR